MSGFSQRIQESLPGVPLQYLLLASGNISSNPCCDGPDVPTYFVYYATFPFFHCLLQTYGIVTTMAIESNLHDR